MCGRFVVNAQIDEMARLFTALTSNTVPPVPNFNVCPTNQVHVVRSGDTRRQLLPMRWGFLPSWYKTENAVPLLTNARAETIAEKPAFREACRARRCILIATGFYEWTKTPEAARLPWFIRRTDEAMVAFAGIWQDWGPETDRQSTCAIVTTPANQHMAQIHHRMPLILEPDDWPLWLGEAGHGAARLMRPGGEEILTYHRVAPAVNSNRASGAELDRPVA
ncbi:SOS response-associated peptidase [Ruegeria sp. 2205SS24-7]|uniref:SOS response-associated peptidase n=1 Tax=Ruegeria discodermiae TaxID=3064389 RepID=UPI002741AAFF|nr:SOS response-associated peptidase [Ruegeria sp. 2205SS24-7]MDP5216933.1 SOS response-associated peptidase [Ruegeria sp. 2205SS24-7]